MSRGPGALQRKILTALTEVEANDYPPAAALPQAIEFFRLEYSTDGSEDDDFRAAIAANKGTRWRWYTIDLLGIVGRKSTRSARSSAHRAVRQLARNGELEMQESFPYPQRKLAVDSIDHYETGIPIVTGGFALNDLAKVDDRWPSRRGRTLWFRRPPRHGDFDPAKLDEVIDRLDECVGDYDSLAEDSHPLDSRDSWQVDCILFLRWLFCGPSAPASTAKSR